MSALSCRATYGVRSDGKFLKLRGALVLGGGSVSMGVVIIRAGLGGGNPVRLPDGEGPEFYFHFMKQVGIWLLGVVGH